MVALRVLVLLSVVLLSSLPAGSQVPTLVVTQQGYFLDASDHPVENPSLAVGFQLFATLAHQDNEVPAWSSGACHLQVVKGYYGVQLGAGSGVTGGCGTNLTAAALPPGTPRYLEITVDAAPLTPRLRISDVPNAVSAQVATTSLDTQQLVEDLKSAQGGVNTTGRVHWNQLVGVPAGLADGTDDGNTYTADGTSLELVGNQFRVKAGGIGAALLASDSLSLAKVTGGALTVSSGDVTSTGSIILTGSGNTFAGDGSGLTHLNLGEANAYTDSKVAGLLDATAGDARYLRNTGSVALGGAIKIGTTATCDGSNTGTLRWDSGHLQLCNQSGWVQLDPAPTPTITSVNPVSGTTAGGTTVTIIGTNFAPTTTVSFGGTSATTTYVSPTEIRAVTPSSSAAGAKTVRVMSGSGGFSELVTSYTYVTPGLDAATALASCLATRNAATGAPSGWYFIKPLASSSAFETWCDMTADGGGWTMVIRGVIDTTYDAALGRNLKTSANGMGRAYSEMNFTDLLVRMGDVATGSDWVSFAGVANGTQTMAAMMAARAFTSNSTDFGWTARSTSLNGVAEVDRFTFKLFGTGGDTDTGLFVLTDANVDLFNDATAILSYDGVGMRLKYRDGNYQSTWNTLDQCGACTGQEGYYGGTATTSTVLGGVFAR